MGGAVAQVDKDSILVNFFFHAIVFVLVMSAERPPQNRVLFAVWEPVLTGGLRQGCPEPAQGTVPLEGAIPLPQLASMHLKLCQLPGRGGSGILVGYAGCAPPTPRAVLPAEGRRCRGPGAVPGSSRAAEAAPAGPCAGGAAELQLPGPRGAGDIMCGGSEVTCPASPFVLSGAGSASGGGEARARCTAADPALRSAPARTARPHRPGPGGSRGRSAAGRAPAVSAGRRGALPAGRARGAVPHGGPGTSGEGAEATEGQPGRGPRAAR